MGENKLLGGGDLKPNGILASLLFGTGQVINCFFFAGYSLQKQLYERRMGKGKRRGPVRYLLYIPDLRILKIQPSYLLELSSILDIDIAKFLAI